MQSPAPPVRKTDNLRGVLLMAAAFAFFATGDMLAKLMTGSFHPLQIVWTRQLGLMAGVAIALLLLGPSILRTAHPRLQVARGLLAVTSAALFITAIKYVPLADAIAVSFVAPFMVTALGALVLGETVGVKRWSAVIVGFIGMLVIIRPGLGVTHPAVGLIVIAAAAFALRQVLSRRLASTDRTMTTLSYTALVSVFALTLPLPFVWTTPDQAWQIGVFVIFAGFAAVGEILVIKSLEVGEASALAPVHYSLLIWGVIWGWTVFGDLPDLWTWVGAAIVMATGLYIIQRERRLAKMRR